MRPALFDDQAGDFDRRAGLPPGIAEKVVAALEGLGALAQGNGLVEIGAGTGEIGVLLAGRPIRYAALDRSFPMLKSFRRRSGRVRLIQADGNAEWPIRDGSVSAVFGFRSLHHLRPKHLAAQVERITSGRTAVLVSGRIRREKDGLKEQMRRRMRQLLLESGIEGRDRRDGREELKRRLLEFGWVDLGERVIAGWERLVSPEQCLKSWVDKSGLAGVEMEANSKNAVLESLSQWAEARFGNLSLAAPGREFLVLEIIGRKWGGARCGMNY